MKTHLLTKRGIFDTDISVIFLQLFTGIQMCGKLGECFQLMPRYNNLKTNIHFKQYFRLLKSL